MKKKISDAGIFEFAPLVILRTPLLPYSEWKSNTQKLLHRPEFRTALQTASPSLYEELIKKDFCFEQLSEKARNSVVKYHNRVCFRPTPFGIMAGFSVLKWETSPLSVSSFNDCKVHLLPDFGELAAIFNSCSVARPPSFCYANPTIYKAGNEYRFITGRKEQEQCKTNFRVDSIACSDWLHSLLVLCLRPTDIHELAFSLSKILDQQLDYALDILMQLLYVQVLLPEGLPNITGRDYSILLNRDSLAISNNMHNGKYSIPKFNNLYNGFQNKTVYLNMERPVLKGGLSQEVKMDIIDGLKVGRLLIPCRELPSLEKFRKRFLEKFDRRSMPLMEALDPEFGIGYGDLLQIPADSVLTNGVKWNGQSSSEQTLFWSETVKFLINKLCSGNRIIKLEEADIAILEEEAKDKNGIGSDAPGISVLFRRCNDGKTYIESAGGVSSMNLIGRFTPFNEEIGHQAMLLAEMESSHNPEVIFAEIVHFSDSHVANIERRNAIRDYEIPILTGSGVDSGHRIAVNDLFVAVRGNEIFLWSKQLKKRIIPRLDSAYNHSISDLPVFRFLCDIQGQGLRSAYSFHLKDIFPGLKHYPRIEYNNTVLSLEEWHIGKGEWKDLVQMSKDAIRNWIEKKGLPRLFAITGADRQIVIDSSQDKDLGVLSGIYKNKIPAVTILREFPFAGPPAEKNIKDTSGNYYINQFIAQLYNRQETYRPLDGGILEETTSTLPKRTNYPQDGWLYYKIYCHEGSANNIIGNYIFPLSTELENADIISKWFFIRYNDNGFHIRLRFLVKEGQLQEVMEKCHAVFAELESAGTVSQIQTVPYERELERYGKNIINAETFFHIDSRLAACYLHYCQRNWDQPEYYALVFQSINVLTDKMGLGLKEKAVFHEKSYESLRAELQQHTEIYRELQPVFRKFRNVMTLLHHSLDGNKIVKDEFRRFQASLESFDFNKEISDLFSILPSLVHMQLNRILVCDFRRQEMIVHYIMWKHYISLFHRTKDHTE
ncbi:lantibiotic dehydratase [Rhizosphaericola mali]|uniref:Lantibiotic dehydratase n=1 Tax=Rhizosphaericola mali TaxID=2545455 RepID=A0A5P2G3E3_9BACT|nr:lantibiotic dehydratase [Rhizosphaericola mali]QES87613.1 hypothetical protein E0W69_002660 [Rhizosphaericola mali]